MVVPKNNNKTETNNNKTERFCSSNFLAERSGERDSDKGRDRQRQTMTKGETKTVKRETERH